MATKLNFGSGKITYNELINIDFDKNINNQEDLLKEDLLQVQYGGSYLLDVGWHPEFDKTGQFIIQIINNYDWENPLLKKEASFHDFHKSLSFCVKFIEKLINAGSIQEVNI